MCILPGYGMLHRNTYLPWYAYPPPDSRRTKNTAHQFCPCEVSANPGIAAYRERGAFLLLCVLEAE